MASAEPGLEANPLLVGWLKDRYDQALSRGSKGSLIYRRAYQAMLACPLTFNHPSEAIQLNGIGTKLCNELTEKMEKHCKEQGLPAPIIPAASGQKRKRTDGEEAAKAKSKTSSRSKSYVPTLRTGPYAIIKALSMFPDEPLRSFSKAELIDLAQPYCESSFSVPSEAGKFYTAWNSMNTLLNKDLVQERGRPLRKYTLTEEGWEVAEKIKKVERVKDKADPTPQNSQLATVEPKKLDDVQHTKVDRNDDSNGNGDGTRQTHRSRLGAQHMQSSQNSTVPIEPVTLSSDEHTDEEVPQPKTSLSEPDINHLSTNTSLHVDNVPESLNAFPPDLPNFTPITLAPGSFEVRLVLDNREIRTREDRDYIADELKRCGVTPVVRPLSLGDVFWVAEVKDPAVLRRHGEEYSEIALDWIVERKRLDDLVSSITDGRFQEQKFRLRRSGIANVIYLVEDFSLSQEKANRFGESITSAIASMQVVNGYFVKRTTKLDGSIRYLARMTKLLKKIYEPRTLSVIPSSILNPQTHLRLMQHLQTPAPAQDTANAGQSQPDSRSTIPKTMKIDNISTYHITDASFASLASKSDTLTLRDVFLKMLMCTRGLGAEKALAIQKHWPTPRILMDAFEKCENDQERRGLLESRLGKSVGRSAIKGVLSAKIGDIWGMPHRLDE